MKFKEILCIALFLALITASAVSATPSKNSEMPTEDQFSTWISGFSGDANFVSSAYNGYIEEFPKCHVDKIESNGEIVGIVFYTYDPSEGAEGYDSYYYDAKGDKMDIGCDGSFKLVDSYKGEGSPEKEVTEEEDEKETEHVGETATESARTVIKNGIKTEGKNTFEDLGKALDDYDGKLSCKSLKCANSLKEYLQEKGFKANVEIRVNIETEDEGDVYITL